MVEPPTCHRHCPRPETQPMSQTPTPQDQRYRCYYGNCRSGSSPQQVTVLSSPREEQTGGDSGTAGEVEGCQALPTQQLAVTCGPCSCCGFWSQRKAAGSDWEAQLLVTSMEPQGGGQGGALCPRLRVADPPLKHSHRDRHAARTPGLACGLWTQAGHLLCGAGPSTPLPQAVSAHVLSRRAQAPSTAGSAFPSGRGEVARPVPLRTEGCHLSWTQGAS